MKLVKLSLIAAMATGIMATTASAAPLDEVIKDVDASGMLRMRYTHDSHKDADKNKDGNGNWNFKSTLNLKTKIDDNFFAVAGIRYNDTDRAESRSGKKINQKGFDLNRAYFGYAVGNTVVQVGRQDVGAFFTDDMFGDGIKVLNSDIEGLTLAALWMDALENDSDIKTFDDEDVSKLIKDSTGKNTTDHNLYGVAALGSYDPVSFQVWYAILEDVTDLFAVEFAFSFDVSDDVNLNAKLQYGFSDFDSSFKRDVPAVDDADFYGAELGTKLFGADLSAGYVDFSTDKDKVSLVSFEDSGKFIKPGEELFDYTLFEGKNHYWFVTAGYTIPDTGLRIGADYLDGKNKVVDEKTDMKEVVGRIEYAHSDKLKFQTWYSHVKQGDDKNDKVRFEAKYSF
ncbi:major outer membrane protein [Campylobacter ureolyticus]|uniref:Major outer membrane protein n=1 Tax=Campylobacter ureolyticus TaxID=827 RepID=S5U2A1_9BACT|nr:major outer membrane protein [Campylobacter ureolyticus]AGS56914.1 major outer membrane protein (Cmp/PorA) [Campylobacter ureolyticus DSM 20703]MCR8684949.1 major outer membrane protein [Campylobacter ureolyticus]QKF83697.1 major outer membrane protein [Campylobacter ureolyticus]QQY36147.1 major outer membrane protein [Campylobacter ureolyticus]SUX24982.1 major outer membrane protein [Campylobacter ureolyticus]